MPLLPRASRSEPLAPVRSGRFAVVGDLQRTSRAEIWRESNGGERERIVRQVASERPDFLVLLGDLVFRGSSRRDWRQFDALMAPIREAGIPILPILGNHEYWISRRGALANYFASFPHLTGRGWYSAAYGPLGLIFLDSNRRFLSALRWREQVAWYERELEEFEDDRARKGVLVFVHHPPYTNSTVTSDEAHVQREFVPAFQRASKTLAMLSGHVHSYERFARAGKTFLVAGGGGGPRVRLATDRRRRHADDLFCGPPLRHFHFLLLALSQEGVEVEARGLPKRGETFAPMDCFLLRWREAAAAPP
ncbi:MAG: metallophosphoesterase family protein [Acidobacteriota bacterium]